MSDVSADNAHADVPDNPHEFDRPHVFGPHALGLGPQAFARLSAGTRINETGAVPRVLVPEQTTTKLK
jgi:hypothetical protein